MQFSLLINLEVFDYLEGIPRSQRQQLLSHFRKLQEFPGNYGDYIEIDEIGRRLDVSLFGKFAVHYWTDSADKHVKIMRITLAD